MNDKLWAYNQYDIVTTRGLYEKYARITQARRAAIRTQRQSLNPFSDLDYSEQERIRRAGRKLPPLINWRDEVM